MELNYGVVRGKYSAEALSRRDALLRLFVSLPLDDESALLAGRHRAMLEARGDGIEAYDYLISGIALANNLVVVTHNVRHFSRIPGLQWEDWEA